MCEIGLPAPGRESLPPGYSARCSRAFLPPASSPHFFFFHRAYVTSKWHKRNVVLNLILGNETFPLFLPSSSCASPLTPTWAWKAGPVIAAILQMGNLSQGFKELAFSPHFEPTDTEAHFLPHDVVKRAGQARETSFQSVLGSASSSGP